MWLTLSLFFYLPDHGPPAIPSRFSVPEFQRCPNLTHETRTKNQRPALFFVFFFFLALAVLKFSPPHVSVQPALLHLICGTWHFDNFTHTVPGPHTITPCRSLSMSSYAPNNFYFFLLLSGGTICMPLGSLFFILFCHFYPVWGPHALSPTYHLAPLLPLCLRAAQYLYAMTQVKNFPHACGAQPDTS